MEWFNFAGTSVTGDGIQALKGMQCRSLGLDDTKLNDVACETLSKCVRVHNVGLSRTLVTDVGVGHLGEMKDMRGLWLEGTQVTDKGLLQLRGLRDLEKLYLYDTQVTSDGIERLLAALPKRRPPKDRHLPTIMPETPEGFPDIFWGERKDV